MCLVSVRFLLFSVFYLLFFSLLFFSVNTYFMHAIVTYDQLTTAISVYIYYMHLYIYLCTQLQFLFIYIYYVHAILTNITTAHYSTAVDNKCSVDDADNGVTYICLRFLAYVQMSRSLYISIHI
jgi:hypothetical protein